MRFHILGTETSPISRTDWAIVKRIFAVLLGILVSTTILDGQQTETGTDADTQTIKALMRRIEQLEAADKQLQARVEQLEKVQQALAQPSITQLPTHLSVSSEAPANEQSAALEPEKSDADETLLNIRGFGDYSFHGDTQKGTSTSFTFGQIDLFITSHLSDRFRFLTDLVFERGRGNSYEEDLERVLLEYRYNDHLKLAVGRYNTAIGYYNLAFRHSGRVQTATGRPFLFLFEDEGGILPTHNVGVSASGLIPSGNVGLHYIAEIGNGRASRPGFQSVQNFVDENHHKSLNLALFARPDAVPGLQVGFSVYRDVLAPAELARIGETILAGYAALARPRFEWLNEALVIRHAPRGLPHVFDTPGFYTQISRRFGSYRPYLRYQYVNASDDEPVFLSVYNTPVGLQHGPSVGLRYDATESVAIKLQYDYTALRHQQAISGLALQLGFAF